MTGPQVVEADLTWTGDEFASGVQVAITAEGRIGRIGRLDSETTHRLQGRALLPGLVNAHSHAFQRGLRGQGERFPAGSGSFWTWREAMYQLVESLDASRFSSLCRKAFREMRAGGITTVGEFHYLHHDEPLDFRLDRMVIEAAQAAGVRLVLLSAYYRTGGIGLPLAPPQRRFATPSPEAYWASLAALGQGREASHVTLGAVVHSIRAADLDDLRAIHAEALRRGMVFHIHVEEQRREVEECLAAYGRTPMRALLERLDSLHNVTAVHCTHTSATDRSEFLARGGRICICPLTEANLGDGIPTLEETWTSRLCLGTDSNARIDLVEEARWLEYGQRLRREARGALRDETGTVARVLLEAATSGGADALGVPTGRMAEGQWADFLTLDLTAPTLADVAADRLLEAWLFGGGGDLVRETCVGGVWRKRGAGERGSGRAGER